jgi:hypothetical protein
MIERQLRLLTRQCHVYRPDVDLRIERLSDRSVYMAGYGGDDDGDLDYRERVIEEFSWFAESTLTN